VAWLHIQHGSCLLAVPLLCQVLLQHVDAPVTLNLALKQPALLFLHPLELSHDAAVLLLQLMHKRQQLVMHVLLLQHLLHLVLQLRLLLPRLRLPFLLVGGFVCCFALLVVLVYVRLHCTCAPWTGRALREQQSIKQSTWISV